MTPSIPKPTAAQTYNMAFKESIKVFLVDDALHLLDRMTDKCPRGVCYYSEPEYQTPPMTRPGRHLPLHMMLQFTNTKSTVINKKHIYKGINLYNGAMPALEIVPAYLLLDMLVRLETSRPQRHPRHPFLIRLHFYSLSCRSLVYEHYWVLDVGLARFLYIRVISLQISSQMRHQLGPWEATFCLSGW